MEVHELLVVEGLLQKLQLLCIHKVSFFSFLVEHVYFVDQFLDFALIVFELFVRVCDKFALFELYCF